MYFCKAFDAKHNQCLASVLTDRDVCKEHSNFYDPIQWFQRYPLNIENEDDDYFFSSSDKLKKVYTTAILGGFITITQDHLRDLVDTGKPIESLVDYYLLCCLQPGVDPLWNSRLFHQTSKEIADCHNLILYEHVQRDKNFLYRLLEPLFNNDVRAFDTILYHLLFNIALLEDNYKTYSTKPMYLDNPDISLLQYVQSHSKFNNEFLWKHSVHSENTISLISSRNLTERSISKKILDFLLSLPEKRKARQEYQRASFTEKAEEIVSVAWAPERVTNWCMSHDESKDIETRWS